MNTMNDTDNEYTPPNDGDFSERPIKFFADQHTPIPRIDVTADPCDSYAAQLSQDAAGRKAGHTR